MKKIAIIQEDEKHTEVFGGLIEMCGFNQIDIYFNKYPADFISYYKKIFNSIMPTLNLKFYNLEKHNIPLIYDLYIYNTGVEYNGQTPKDKTLLLSHHVDEIKELRRLKPLDIIAITPIYEKYNINSFLNVFHGPVLDNKIKSKINLLIVGLTNPTNKDIAGVKKLLHTIQKNKLQDYFMVNIINYWEIKSFDKYVSEKFCKLHININANKTMSLLSKSDFVLTIIKKNSDYHKKQLTGILPLSISLGVPLVIDDKLANIYGLTSKEAVIYKNSDVDTLSKIVVQLTKQDSVIRKKYIIELRNKIIFNNIIKFKKLYL
jgi:hypothetical protein